MHPVITCWYELRLGFIFRSVCRNRAQVVNAMYVIPTFWIVILMMTVYGPGVLLFILLRIFNSLMKRD
ncbi:Uncharacterised protein [Klebsiella oxytoca]|nr:Uncharacterised protein [Klebsiella oxytoca]SAQ52913.1 Uncharacterised protein [Klebsiella oxytoca]